MVSTDWSNISNTATTWSPGSVSTTTFSGRDVTNLGAIMDDSVYTMDSELINMDDAKLNTGYAPTTDWTT